MHGSLKRIGWRLLVGALLSGAIAFAASERASVGVRPYELEWAGRTEDTRTPLVDFEEMSGWTVEATAGTARLERSTEQPLWGRFTAKLSYHAQTAGEPASFVIRPPRPIPVPASFDSINVWVWNDHWVWQGDRGPTARLSLLLESRDGRVSEIAFPRNLDWPEWWLAHTRLSAAERAALQGGAKLTGIRLANCRAETEKAVFFDNLVFYEDRRGPIQPPKEPRPGFDATGADQSGPHTGPNRLPFPTREQTVLPRQLSGEYTGTLTRDAASYVFRYMGGDGTLEFRYEPVRGDLGDVTARWIAHPEAELRPMAGGGLWLATDHEVEGLLNWSGVYVAREPKAAAPNRRELIDCRQVGETVAARWRVGPEGQWVEVVYTFRLWQKSLVVDVQCAGGEVGEVAIGRVEGAASPRLVEVPYWTGEDQGSAKSRPAVLVMGPVDRPLFLSAFLDHYRSGASQWMFATGIDAGAVACGGSARYLPRTDGRRNDCCERIFITLSPRFEEVLPSVANPPSPWRNTAAEYLMCHHGASDRAEDYEAWQRTTRYGMTKVVVLDHEVGWRDHAESFTFRTVPAPGKGGDAGLRDYARKLQALGVRYGIYNNYTDLSPLNSHWEEDRVSLLPDGQWQSAWYRCYAPKPARIADLEQALTTVIQEKFQLSAAYCDVHTAVTPWRRVDYDARLPGAAALATPFYAFGQVMLHQQKVWNGPVYSEGGNHWYYAGLVTGNKSDDRGYDVVGGPWLVDFDLRQLHPLGCDVGLGKRSKFAATQGRRVTDDDWDRYFAGTIAFGHVGDFFNLRGRITPLVLRSYYLLQQLQSVYARDEVREIRYADAHGVLLDSSAAVATGAYRRSQLKIDYAGGLEVWVNGNPEANWPTPHAELPPNGFFARSRDGGLIVSSAIVDGRRTDYVHSPAYDYVDGRGGWCRSRWGASDGQIIIINQSDGSREVIPFQTKRFAVVTESLPARVIALDEHGTELGPANGEIRDGLFFIQPVQSAISYHLILRGSHQP